MNIEDSWETMATRGSEVRKMLSNISRAKQLATKAFPSASTYVISVFDSEYSAESDYHKLRFKTSARHYSASYYERWFVKPREQQLYLDRAYLTIWRSTGPVDEKEFLCLHCDPNEPETADHSLYKRSPHLHIKVAEHPFPKAHIALSLANLTDILTSTEKFQDAMEWAILMVREEVLDRLVATP